MHKYKITELPHAREDFKKVFKSSLGGLLMDGAVIAVLGYIVIDIVALDAWIKKEHGDFETDGLSLNKAIQKYYGESGVQLIDKLLI